MNKNEINELKQEYESLMAKLAELTAEELQQVTGGANGYDNVVTHMVCIGCPYHVWWDGDFLFKTFDCPACKNHTLYGKERKDK